MYSLFIGDDTNGLFGRKFMFTPVSDLDLTGCIAQFTVGDITKTFTDMRSGVAQELVFTRAQTGALRRGVYRAKLGIYDPTGRYRTLSNDILVKATDVVEEVYSGDENHIRFSIDNAIPWESITGKPELVTRDALRGALSGLEVPDTANQREVRVAFQTLLSRLRALAMCAVACACACAFGIGDDTPWDEVPPTNTVKSVVERFSPPADFSTGNTQLVATIKAEAPAPGNYAAVSNAAMSAVQPAELAAATNGIPRIEAADPDMFPGWAQNAVGAGHANYADESGRANIADSARSLVDGTGTETRMSDTIFMQLDSIAGKASTNDVQLSPVYSGGGEGWTIYRDGANVTAQVEFFPQWIEHDSLWAVGDCHIPGDVIMSGVITDSTADATTLSWEGSTDMGEAVEYSAVRSAPTLVGYVLGSQTDKVLASTNLQSQAGVSAATVTNIVRDLSLGGIWDSQLEVWWTPRMRNGSLTYEATTNVNLNAGN